jgi:hypothetical protein
LRPLNRRRIIGAHDARLYSNRRQAMRHSIAAAAAAVLLVLVMPAAQAQGAASAPASAPGMGMGPGGMHGWRMNRSNTPGWSLMTRAERQAHHDKMRSMTDHAACVAYMEQHHAQMTERAKERGRAVPAKPRGDPCAALVKK